MVESKRFRTAEGETIEVYVKPYDKLFESLYQPSPIWESVVIENTRKEVEPTIRIDCATFASIIKWLKTVGDGEFWKFIEKEL